jgi:6-phosphofructokinase 1
MECRFIVLGHLQRGGSPTAFDRWLASRFGAAAFRLAEKGIHGQMVALVGGEVVSVTLEEALAEPNRVDPNGDGVLTARNLGLSLGD